MSYHDEVTVSERTDRILRLAEGTVASPPHAEDTYAGPPPQGGGSAAIRADVLLEVLDEMARASASRAEAGPWQLDLAMLSRGELVRLAAVCLAAADARKAVAP